jgi:hypothetical protein
MDRFRSSPKRGWKGYDSYDSLGLCAAVIAQVARLLASLGTQPAGHAMRAWHEADLGMQQTWKSALRSSAARNISYSPDGQILIEVTRSEVFCITKRNKLAPRATRSAVHGRVARAIRTGGFAAQAAGNRFLAQMPRFSAQTPRSRAQGRGVRGFFRGGGRGGCSFCPEPVCDVADVAGWKARAPVHGRGRPWGHAGCVRSSETLTGESPVTL